MPPGPNTVAGAYRAVDICMGCWVTPLGQVAILTASGAQVSFPHQAFIVHLVGIKHGPGTALGGLTVQWIPSQVDGQGSISGSKML